MDMIETIKIMLDALENHTAIKHPQQIHYRDRAIEAGRQAVARAFGTLEAEKQSAQHGEPVAIYQYQKGDGSWIDQEKQSYDYNVKHGHATVRVVYTTPQQRKPLTDKQIEVAAKKLAKCFDYPWEHMTEKGRENMRLHAQAVIEAANATFTPSNRRGT
jgi:hypothetical protein